MSERKYPPGYKPKICYINATIFFYPKDQHAHMISGAAKLVAHAKKHLKKFEIKQQIITLNDDYKFPTNNMKDLFYKKMWLQYEPLKSRSYSEFIFVMRDMELIKELGRVSYDFDETIH